MAYPPDTPPHLPNILSHIPMGKLLPIGIKILCGIAVLSLLMAIIVYGISLYYEHQVLNIGQETRAVNEDNLGLQINLDRLRAYEKVADDSAAIQGLRSAEEVINVASENVKPVELPKEVHSSVPRRAYGY